jgi:plastocyanin
MRRKMLTLLVLAAAVTASVPAEAAVNLVVAGPGSQATQSYVTPVVVTTVGGPLTFRNQDVQTHNVTSDAVGPDSQPWCEFFAAGGCPLFWSPSTDAGGRESQVGGLENAEAGETYGFHCVIHPQVRGTLVVV